ncbi:hypothetical protein ACLB2K_041641 [Fragaria x ananassa]
MHIFKQLLPGISQLNGARKYYQASCFAFIHSCPKSSVEVHSEDQEVVIALGSNVGDRLHNFNEALQLMKKPGMQITRHGCLYETAPAYITDQPNFLNSAVRAVTKLGPHERLGALKRIEKDLGRTQGIRYGPRPIDLDILFYGKLKVRSKTLTIPHERIWERPFVIAPLMDLLGSAIDSDVVACWHSFSTHSGGLFESWEKLGGDSLIGKEDSFSDGGKFESLEAAVSQVQLMISEGADMIDIGAQSTRAMASRISVEQELDRLIPVLEAVVRMPEVEGKLVSVDTFHSEVASEAVRRGAHIVNDVSAGQLDSNMLSVVAGLGVASELLLRVRDAEVLGIPAWRIIIDLGIGFSKNTEQNLDILMGLPNIEEEIGRRSLALSHAPIMIGPSRKKFLGEVCNRKAAIERDPATVASVTAGVLAGANIVRVHNVRDNLDAVKLCDAMRRQKRAFPQIKKDF